MGGRPKSEAHQKKKKYEVNSRVVGVAKAACDAVVVAGHGVEDALIARIVSDVTKVLNASRPEQQTQLVAAWGPADVFRAITTTGTHAAFWRSFCNLLVSIFFCHNLEHLQKVLKGANALTSAPPQILTFLREDIFPIVFGEWQKSRNDAHLNTICDIDCLLDTRPLFVECVSNVTMGLLDLAVSACEAGLRGVTGSAMLLDEANNNDEGEETQRVVEHLKYFLRITQDLLQKRDNRSHVTTSLRLWAQSPAPTPITRLLSLSQTILSSATTYPKELVAPAGYALSLVLVCVSTVLSNEGAVQATFLRSCVAEGGSGGSGSSSLVECVAEAMKGNATPVCQLYTSFGDMARIAIVSGLVNSGADVMYLAEVDAQSTGCLLFTEALSLVEALTKSSDPRVKFFALQTARMVVQKTLDYLGKPKEKQVVQPGLTPEAVGRAVNRVLEIQWELWDEPTAQVGHILTAIFKLSVEAYQAAGKVFAAHPESALDLDALCKKLLLAPWQRRGKYPSLVVMLAVVGVEKIQQLAPWLVARTLEILHVKNLAHGAGDFIAEYAKALMSHGSTKAGSTTPEGMVRFMSEVMTPIGEALLLNEPQGVAGETAQSLLMTHTCNYALQPLFATRGKCKEYATERERVHEVILEHLFGVAERALEEGHVASSGLVRRLTACYVTLCRIAKQSGAAVVTDTQRNGALILEHALTAESDTVRMAAVRVLCIGFRPSALPTRTELGHLKAFTVRNFKTADASFRAQHFDVLKQMLSRVKDSLHRYERDRKKSRSEGDGEADSRAATEEYLQWLCRYLVHSSYATSPLDRRCMALEMLAHIAKVFTSDDTNNTNVAATDASSVYHRTAQSALPQALLPVLLGTISEAWDRVRHATWELLRLYPSPLPGYATEAEVHGLVQSCDAGMHSYMIKDADSAALLYRLLHRKYAVHLGYNMCVNPVDGKVLCLPPSNHQQTEARTWEIHHAALSALVARITTMKEARDRRGGFAAMHGVLGAMRHVLIDAELKHLESIPTEAHQTWVALLSNAAGAVVAMCTDAMRNVAGATTGDIEALREGDDVAQPDVEQPLGVDCRGHAFFADRNDQKGDRLVVVNSWLAVKEGCALLTELLLNAPLGTFVPADLVNSCGLFFLNMGLQGKHNGVIAKASEALGQVCYRVIRLRGAGVAESTLRALPSVWLRENLLEGQVKSHSANRILRRSAGLPPMLLSVLDAEDHTQGVPQMAHETIDVLLDIANMKETDSVDEEALKLRTAHKINALNVLKYVVDDSYLREVVAVYGSRLLLLSVEGFNHEAWNVRNSSLMLFSSLLHRVVGAGHGTTSLKDFLQRNAQAVPALMRLLGSAVSQGGDSGGRITELHPALHPLLVLFSLLSPSSDLHSAAMQTAYFTRDITPYESFGSEGKEAARILQDVESCHALKHSLARSMSACALVPLVATHALSNAMAFFVRDAARLLDLTQPMNNNMLHGRMMQLLEVARHARTLEPSERSGVAVGTVNAILSSSFLSLLQGRLATRQGSVAPPNIAACLQLVSQLLQEKGQDPAWSDLARQARIFSKNVMSCDMRRIAVHEIAGDEVLGRSAVLFIRASVLRLEVDDVAQFLTHTVLSTSNASRLEEGTKDCRFLVDALGEAKANLPVIKKHCSAKAWQGVVEAVLAKLRGQAECIAQTPGVLSDIQHAENFSSVLDIFALITETDHNAVPLSARGDIVRSLSSIRESCPNQGVVRALLKQQAALAHQSIVAELGKPGGAADLSDLLQYMCDSLYKFSNGNETTEVRKGSAEALAVLRIDTFDVTQLCGEVGSVVLEFLVNMQRVRIALLSDEDDDVRGTVAATVAAPPTNLKSPIPSALKNSPGISHSERSVEHCFSWLTHLVAVGVTIGAASAVKSALHHMASIVLHPATIGAFSVTYEGEVLERVDAPQLSFERVSSDQNNVLFEAENHNYHIEELMAVQLAAKAGRTMLEMVAEGNGGDVLTPFVAEFAARLLIEAKTVNTVCSKDPTIRALAFTSIFRLNLAALLILPYNNEAAKSAAALVAPTAVESLWLSPLAKIGSGVSTETVFDEVLFLTP